ncbi:MAG: sigma 54-interacting transcriptional regulator [Bacillota bacterium]|nr:sigma 54-interacting transcriptional regulator [Bacillota bacterium]
MIPDQLNRLIHDHSVDELWVTDGKGNTVYVNSACEKIYGAPAETLLGRNVAELEQMGFFQPAIATIVLRQRRQITLTQRTRTGRVMLVTGTPVFDSSGDICYVLENSRDVTALEDMRREFERSAASTKPHRSAKSNPPRSSGDLLVNEANPVWELCRRAASTDAAILLVGESGSGKSRMASYIHENSSRANRPFLRLSCPALPEELLESELFGYRAGAFTGASSKGKLGLLATADGGTVLLDDISDLPLSVQPKLLHVLEGAQFIPVGATKTQTIDVRFIAATNQDLRSLVSTGRFRADLFYRLSIVTVRVPSLREQCEDIPELAAHFLHRLNRKYPAQSKRISWEAIEHLRRYEWPGNVRELAHILEHLFVTCTGDVIDVADLPPHLMRAASQSELADPRPRQGFSREHLIELYDRLGSTYKVAAATGLSQSGVYRMIGSHVRQRGRRVRSES